jgi:hypothetical protein
LNSSLRSPFAKNVARGSLRKSKAQGKTESALSPGGQNVSN